MLIGIMYAKRASHQTKPAGAFSPEPWDKCAAHAVAAVKVYDLRAELSRVPSDTLERFTGANIHTLMAIIRAAALGNGRPACQRRID